MKRKMSLVYGWTHWFWITALTISSVSAGAIPLSSFETISTSLKSAMVPSDNTFQPTNEQSKLAAGSKSVPLTFETADSDDLFGGVGELDAESSAKNQEWLSKPEPEKEAKPAHVELEKAEIVASLTLPNLANSSSNSSQVATTMLSSVTESITGESSMKTTTTQTTKLIKVGESDEQILSVKSLNVTDANVSQGDTNDTVEIVMTEDANSTEVSEVSERRSKGLIGYSEEAKVVNNISSRSTLQVAQSSATSDDRLSSEALFDTDEDNGGITMSAGIISVICVGIIGSLSAFSIMFVYVYRRRFLNKPQTLSEPDSSGYIDESSIRDNSDELYSLDNDSFLNSLEAMTIQNYWTDSVKHTKL